MEFKIVNIEEKENIKKYLANNQSKLCDNALANILLWGRVYDAEYTIIDDKLILKFVNKGKVNFAIQSAKKITKELILKLMDYCKKENIKFNLVIIEPHIFEQIQQLFPDTFKVEYDRAYYDYLYLKDDLLNLKGKKYDGKRNHINKFKKNNPDWKYETLDANNYKECIDMLDEWVEEKGDSITSDTLVEKEIVIDALSNYSKLDLMGGLIRSGNRVVAFTLGEQLTNDTFVIHFEKAYSDIQGAYPIINQQFIEHELDDFTYINREEDLGIEGLRRAKMSYHPYELIKKGILTVN